MMRTLPKNDQPESVDSKYYRPIRSFVLRQSRLTKAQHIALKEHAHRYIYPFNSDSIEDHLQSKPLDVPQEITEKMREQLSQSTQSYEKKIVEIGFGNGDSLVSACQMNPKILFFGIDVHLPGIARLIHRSNQANISNLQIIRTDAQQIMKTFFPRYFFDQIRIFFPDPWHKKRHHKRRLINQSFIENSIQSLMNNGILHIATDWQDYADWIKQSISPIQSLSTAETKIKEKVIVSRPKTAYEKRGIALDHTIHELIYQLNINDD